MNPLFRQCGLILALGIPLVRIFHLLFRSLIACNRQKVAQSFLQRSLDIHLQLLFDKLCLRLPFLRRILLMIDQSQLHLQLLLLHLYLLPWLLKGQVRIFPNHEFSFLALHRWKLLVSHNSQLHFLVELHLWWDLHLLLFLLL